MNREIEKLSYGIYRMYNCLGDREKLEIGRLV